MRKTLMLAAMLATALGSMRAEAQVGFLLGVTQRMDIYDGVVSDLEKVAALPGKGVFVGFDYNLPLAIGLSINPGVRLCGTVSMSEDGMRLDPNQTACQVVDVEGPLLLKWKLNLTKDISVAVFAGPRFNYGLTYKDQQVIFDLEGEAQAGSWRDWLSEDVADKALERFSMAGEGGVELTLKKFRVMAEYCVGVTDLKSAETNESFKYNRLNVGLGLVF